MSKIKSLVLGSAAAIVAIGGAQAADLPVKAKAVEYVKVCSLYGAGFYYIPGTDTCIRIGGYLRAEVTFGGAPSDATYLNGDGGLGLRTAGQYQSRARIMMNVDTRTATEYGVVRTFGAFGPQFTFGATNAGTDVQANGGMRVEAAFIQFAGFTFGRSASAYALPWNGAPGNLNSTLMGGPNYDAGVNNIQYTWQFGNGVSASVGIDTQEAANRVGVLQGIPTVFGAYTNQYAAPTAPDVVGNIRLDQAWGLLQFSAAAHEVTGAYYTGTASAGHPSDKWGFAVTGALQLKNLPTGPGDDLKIDAIYANGATRYVIATSGVTPNFLMFGDGLGGAYRSVGFGYSSDGVYGTGSQIELTTAWGIRGAFAHNWNPNWQTTLFGSYSSVDYNGQATGLYCAQYKVTVPGAYKCDPDFKVYQVGTRTTWTPVKNLALSAEVLYAHLDQSFEGSAAYAGFGASLAKPAAVYSYGDQGTVSVNFRAQRNF